MSQYGSKPTSTTSIDSTVASWSGQSNPKDAHMKDINVTAHGFNKANGKSKFQEGSNRQGGASPGSLKEGG